MNEYSKSSIEQTIQALLKGQTKVGLLQTSSIAQVSVFAEGRRLGRTGPYLGELLVPPGRYGIHVAREGYERGWEEITLAETPGAVDVHFVLKADR